MDHWPHTDLHLHATYYRLEGARPEMTVANIVRRVRDAGYAAAGIVEHLDTHPKHPLSCLEALVAEFRALVEEQAAAQDGTLDRYVGAELDGQEAGISIPDAQAIKERLGLHYCLGGVHGLGEHVTSVQAYVEDHHRRLMGIVASPTVDVVVHPWCGGHSYARRERIEGWRFEWIPERLLIELIDGAVQTGKAIEINAKVRADVEDPAFHHYLDLLRDSGVPVTVGSDAHSMERVGTIDPLIASISTLLMGATAVLLILLDRLYGLDRVLVGKG